MSVPKRSSRTKPMKPPAIIGIILIVVGVAILAFGGFSFTSQKKLIDAGPVQVNTEQTKSVPISPIAGYGALIAGVVLLVAGSRRA